MNLRSVAGFFAIFCLASQAAAQTNERPEVLARVGFVYPGNRAMKDGEFKAGAWTPVYIEVSCGARPLDAPYVVFESVDADEVRSHYTVRVGPLQPGERRQVIAYTKPGSQSSEMAAMLMQNGRVITESRETYSAMDLEHQLILVIGKQAASLRAHFYKKYNKDLDPEDASTRDVAPQRVTGFYGPEGITMMPRLWFGYSAADLILFTTGDRSFLEAFEADKPRKDALAEWVRRGGHLIVSVAANQDMVGKIDFFQSVLPVAVEGQATIPRLVSIERTYAQAGSSPLTLQRGVPVAKLTRKPGRVIESLAEENKDLPLVVRGSYGLGQVTVFAFDVDENPFRGWAGSSSFWNKALPEAGLPDRTSASRQNQPQVRYPGQYDADSDVATGLHKGLEDFPDVPVISFGWVALFILIYIVIVGPLDYLFLKKVVKRLELTWITFPAVVLTISVAAYFTAYWLKGNDQKINKVDFMDVDLHTNQMYGHTWFTIFSPRIQNYTVSIEPLGGKELRETGGQTAPTVLMSWFGRPETNWGGQNRPRSQGLFRRAYDYSDGAAGMVGVPIQVWSTKSFTGTWQVPLDSARPQIVADLSAPVSRPENVVGTLTNNLPFALEDTWIFVGLGTSGRWHSLGNIEPGATKKLEKLNDSTGSDMAEWMNTTPGGSQAPTVPGSSRSYGTSVLNLKQLLFYEGNAQLRSARRNNSLRELDQSWRLNRRGEAVVFARIARGDGPAEQVASDPKHLAKLWIGSLPGGAEPRQPLLGTMAQESFVRILIPVKETERR